MAFNIKVWNQGNDGQTMGIRIEDTAELNRFALTCIFPDIAGTWSNLQDYMNAASIAAGAAPMPYSRFVDVVWLNPIGYGALRYFPGRTLVATYTGNQRVGGGFAVQCYCIVDPTGYPALAPHHRTPLQMHYLTHRDRDAIVVF
jgi:hypothetical protein